MSRHFCRATGCRKRVPVQLLMCEAHWHALPIKLRMGVWRTYEAGCHRGTHPTEEYAAAVKRAIDWLDEHPTADDAPA